MDQIKEFSVTVYGNLIKYSDTISKARCRIFYRGANRNGSYITDEFAEQLLATIPYAPVKGIFEESDDDFTDHGAQRDFGKIYGVVPENPNLTWEEFLDEDGVMREYACVDVLLYTSLYEEAAQIPGKSQSMELYAPSIKGEWEFIEGRKVFKFTEGCFLGLQVLGDKTEPCFEGAAFFSLYENLINTIKEFENHENQLPEEDKDWGGQSKMKVNFKLSDSQKQDILFDLLNPEFNEEGNWTLSYCISDVYDDYAICYNYEEQQYERVYYTKDDETDSVSISERVHCFIIDVTESEKTALEVLRDMNGGNYELVNENYMKVADHEQKVEELNTTLATLQQEREDLAAQNQAFQEQVDSLSAENSSLHSYKEEKEKAEKMAVIDSYSELLPEEVLDSFKEKIDEFTALDLDKELAYSLKQTNFSAFTKNEFQGVPKDTPLTGIEAILSKY